VLASYVFLLFERFVPATMEGSCDLFCDVDRGRSSVPWSYKGSVLGRHIVLNYIDSDGVHHPLQGVPENPIDQNFDKLGASIREEVFSDGANNTDSRFKRLRAKAGNVSLADLHRLTFFDGASIPEFDWGYWWLAYHEEIPVAFAGVVPSTHLSNAGYFCRVGVLKSTAGIAFNYA
jgi:hypothetical protein